MTTLLTVAPACVQATTEEIAAKGKLRLEGVAFWLGSVSDLQVRTVVVPTGKGVKLGPRGVHLPAEWMSLLGEVCEESGQVVLAGIHSHPFDAFHSEVDSEGFLHAPDFVSIVLPHYGLTSLDEAEDTWAVYVGLHGGLWRPSSWREAVCLDPAVRFEICNLAVQGL